MGNSDSKYNVKSFHGTDFLRPIGFFSFRKYQIPHGKPQRMVLTVPD
jgi:hypothetical protein